MKTTIEQNEKYWVVDAKGDPEHVPVLPDVIQLQVNAGSDPKICKYGEKQWKLASEHGFAQQVQSPAAPVDTGAETPTPPPAQEVNYVALLIERVANDPDVTEEGLLEWAKQSGWAKKRCKSIDKAIDNDAAEKILNGFDAIVSICKTRAAAATATPPGITDDAAAPPAQPVVIAQPAAPPTPTAPAQPPDQPPAAATPPPAAVVPTPAAQPRTRIQ